MDTGLIVSLGVHLLGVILVLGFSYYLYINRKRDDVAIFSKAMSDFKESKR